MNKHFYVYIMTNKRHNVLYNGVTNDLQSEKLIKGGSRKKKIDLINSLNPFCLDLFDKF